DSIEQVREISDQWVEDYKYHRPHDALGGVSPVNYKRKKEKTVEGLRSATATPSHHLVLQL
ncbi:MAG: integrase core domain-containing protein, partial [Myroides sp.]|nr:integrase core domain-containing protein [Myroides sp.]